MSNIWEEIAKADLEIRGDKMKKKLKHVDCELCMPTVFNQEPLLRAPDYTVERWGDILVVIHRWHSMKVSMDLMVSMLSGLAHRSDEVFGRNNWLFDFDMKSRSPRSCLGHLHWCAVRKGK